MPAGRDRQRCETCEEDAGHNHRRALRHARWSRRRAGGTSVGRPQVHAMGDVRHLQWGHPLARRPGVPRERAPMRTQLLPSAIFITAVLGLVSCSSSDVGSANSDCAAGETCGCAGTGSCAFNCTGKACRMQRELHADHRRLQRGRGGRGDGGGGGDTAGGDGNEAGGGGSRGRRGGTSMPTRRGCGSVDRSSC